MVNTTVLQSLAEDSASPVPDTQQQQQRALRWMFSSAALSNFDRFATAPMLLIIAHDLGASLASSVVIVTAYFVAYGITQPLWGVLSDRRGRLSVLRYALIGGAICNLVASVAPTLTILIIARSIAGACFGAAIPNAIAYVGDVAEPSKRPTLAANLLALVTLSSVIATLGAAGIAQELNWRLLFGFSAVMALWILVATRHSIDGSAIRQKLRERQQIRRSLSQPIACIVIMLAFLEGATILGVFALLPAMLGNQGASTLTAGAISAAYGVVVLIASRFIPASIRILGSMAPLLIGGSLLILANGAGIGLGVLPLVCTAILLGGAWPFLHAFLQTWILAASEEGLRGTTMSLFSASLSLGSGVGAAACGWFLGRNDQIYFFIISCTAAVVLLGVAYPIAKQQSTHLS